MKVIAILQPGYLPWIGFFDQLLRSDVFVLYDDVNYDKHGWRNRNRIKGPQGPVWLTVPVRTKGLNKPKINEVLIDRAQPRWATKQLGTIRQLYAKAPYFSNYFPRIEEILNRPWKKLVDLDLELINTLMEWLEIDRQMVLSSTLKCTDPDPNKRLVEICRKMGADTFYEGALGTAYIDNKVFSEAGIDIEFQDYNCRQYPQLYGEFISQLSAIDLLFNCGSASRDFV